MSMAIARQRWLRAQVQPELDLIVLPSLCHGAADTDAEYAECCAHSVHSGNGAAPHSKCLIYLWKRLQLSKHNTDSTHASATPPDSMLLIKMV